MDFEEGSVPSHLVEKDLRAVTKWAKNDLFRFVKFLPKGGRLYQYFQRTYRENPKMLPGITELHYETINEEMYVDQVWSEAVSQQIVSNALALRRSAIYTVMQNRFQGNLRLDCLGCLVFLHCILKLTLIIWDEDGNRFSQVVQQVFSCLPRLVGSLRKKTG
jgi:hypothetical protein